MADPGFDTVLRCVAGRGGGDAELCVTRTRDRRYEAREGRLDGIALADTVAFGLRVFRAGRMGFSYGFRGDAADLARMVEEALFCADASDPDAAYGLPDAAGPATDLPLYDASVETVPEEEKGEFARSLEARVLARDPRVKRVRTAALRETVATVSLFHSRGLAATRRESLCSAHVETVAEENGEGQTGYGFGVARSLRGLERGRDRRRGRDPGAADARGGPSEDRGVQGGPRKRRGGRAARGADPVVPLLPGRQGEVDVRGKGREEGGVGGDHDRRRSAGSRRVRRRAVRRGGDPDAAAGADRRRGELRGFLADAFWGRKLGTGTTGACRRPGPKRPPPWGSPTCASPPAGIRRPRCSRPPGHGILLTEFLGIHTADPVSGDFSVGASGIRIAGGALAEPLHGFAVSGNILGLLEKVEAAGSDFRWFGNVGAPSLMVSAISVGGE